MKSKSDPTGQNKARNKGTRALTVRLNRAQAQIKAMFREIPRQRRTQTKIVNAETAVYDYQQTAAEQQALSDEIFAALNDELLESQDRMPPDWYWKDNIEQPYRQGTAEEINRTNQLITAAIVAGLITDPFVSTVEIEQVLTSRQYIKTINSVYVSNFQQIKTLSDRTSAQVIRQINAGIQAGDTPTVIAKAITERFDVAKSSAQRIAETEINKAYNDSKINAVDVMAQRTGLRAGVIHISALTPTTRANHAARHGNAYTTADQQQWWNAGSNRINCLCSTISVLIDAKGNVIQSETQKDIKAERSFFDAPDKKKEAKPKRPVELKSTDNIQQIKTAKPKQAVKPEKVVRPRKPVTTEDRKLIKTEAPPSIPKKVNLTGDQSAYIEYYKGDGFYKSNEVLRNQSAFTSQEVSGAKSMRNSINAAVKKSEITKDGVLYRGIKDRDLFENAEKLIGKDIPILTPQSTASNAGSATGWAGLIGDPKSGFFSANKGQSVVFKIRTKKGQHALNMESLSVGNTAEREILLGSGGRYRVKAVKTLKDPSGNITGKVIEVDYDE